MGNYPGDERMMVKQTQRPLPLSGLQLYTCWWNSGDDLENELRGVGSPVLLSPTPEDESVFVDCHFLTGSEKIYIFECYLAWENAGFGDYMLGEMWAKATPTITVSNGNYNTDVTTRKITPTIPGTGNCTLTGTPTFVRCSNWSKDSATWNGTWDLLTNPSTGSQYPSYNALNKGQYEWYDIDVLVFRFIKFSVFGTNYQPLLLISEDTEQLPPNYYIKVTAVNVSRTSWKFVGNFVFFREHTVP